MTYEPKDKISSHGFGVALEDDPRVERQTRLDDLEERCWQYQKQHLMSMRRDERLRMALLGSAVYGAALTLLVFCLWLGKS